PPLRVRRRRRVAYACDPAAMARARPRTAARRRRQPLLARGARRRRGRASGLPRGELPPLLRHDRGRVRAAGAHRARLPRARRTHVAFVEAGQLWLVPRGGGAARQLTDTPGNKAAPRFSPDGTRIAYSSGDLFTVGVGGGAPKRITYLPAEAALTQWTEDDRL